MNLKNLKTAYENNQISKHDYISKIHQIHRYLFEYSSFIQNTDILKIEIENGSVVMTIKDSGIKLLADKDDERIIPIEILNFESYEKSEMDMILNLIDENYNVLDIGANIGWYSINISNKINKSKIFAFEPIPKTFEYLYNNIKMNQINNINIYNYGLSNLNGEETFYYYPEGSGNASIVNLSQHSNVQKIVCKLKKMDDFAIENDLRIDFIKCDVEGSELSVFQGGMKVIKRDKPIIFTEILRKWSEKFGYNPNEIINMLTLEGYRCFVISEGGLREIYKIDEQTIETNFIFLHSEQHLNKINKFMVL